MYEQEFLCYEKALGLKEIKTEAAISVDDVLDVKVSNGMIMPVKPFRHKSLEERAAEYGGQLHLDGSLKVIDSCLLTRDKYLRMFRNEV